MERKLNTPPDDEQISITRTLLEGVATALGVGETVDDAVGVPMGVDSALRVIVGDSVDDAVGVGVSVDDAVDVVGDGDGEGDVVGDGDGEAPRAGEVRRIAAATRVRRRIVFPHGGGMQYQSLMRSRGARHARDAPAEGADHDAGARAQTANRLVLTSDEGLPNRWEVCAS
jgi:hypothetical protein